MGQNPRLVRLEVDIPRPRKRMEVVEHPSYYSLRSEMIYFQSAETHQETAGKHSRCPSWSGKVNLEIGFVPLTACAPLAVAKEKASSPSMV